MCFHSFSESEAVTGELELTVDDLEHNNSVATYSDPTLTSHKDPSLLAVQYEPHSLSSQLLVLCRMGETLTEEEEPYPEEPIPYSKCLGMRCY